MKKKKVTRKTPARKKVKARIKTVKRRKPKPKPYRHFEDRMSARVKLKTAINKVLEFHSGSFDYRAKVAFAAQYDLITTREAYVLYETLFVLRGKQQGESIMDGIPPSPQGEITK